MGIRRCRDRWLPRTGPRVIPRERLRCHDDRCRCSISSIATTRPSRSSKRRPRARSTIRCSLVRSPVVLQEPSKADPLLAQAAAWYHDLGKTENPSTSSRTSSATTHTTSSSRAERRAHRGHVTDGLELASHFKIPDDVANGIRMHHGTSLMRYFYHKALTDDPEVDPELFRHHGTKPVSKEMAIVMVSDSTEAAARAYAQAGSAHGGRPHQARG